MGALNRIIGRIRPVPRASVRRPIARGAVLRKNGTVIWPVLLLFCCAANAFAQEDQLDWSRNPPYRLSAGDAFSLRFPLTPEFDQSARVRTDGFVNLAGIEDITVEGLTISETSEAIRSAYAAILHDPIVSIELTDFEKPYFIAGGDVNKPGKYVLHGYTSVTDAITMAGGFRDSAKPSAVLLFRRMGDEWDEVKAINVKQILKGRGINEDAEVRAGDMLVVPRSARSKLKKFVP